MYFDAVIFGQCGVMSRQRTIQDAKVQVDNVRNCEAPMKEGPGPRDLGSCERIFGLKGLRTGDIGPTNREITVCGDARNATSLCFPLNQNKHHYYNITFTDLRALERSNAGISGTFSRCHCQYHVFDISSNSGTTNDRDIEHIELLLCLFRRCKLLGGQILMSHIPRPSIENTEHPSHSRVVHRTCSNLEILHPNASSLSFHLLQPEPMWSLYQTASSLRLRALLTSILELL
jgi:hypothetical protein